ncbi:hypothetical protein GIB67_015820 [Kingdonia uniflora]|uniref:Nucleotidyl transferase domain-containing protein n=1 Tax=Kingdonia uniflora TaxID=39325 RepID=A0A7J7NVC8_9MAGN|nr:hypothetical protein GIB67_015820 [Kingdonia uniflora]
MKVVFFNLSTCSRASDFGLMKIDKSGRIFQFLKKPKGENLKSMQADTSILGLSRDDAKRFPYIALMGLYVFKIDVLLDLLMSHYPTSNDFESEIIPMAAEEFNVQILALFEASQILLFLSSEAYIYFTSVLTTDQNREVPGILNSIISHGCFLKDCHVEHSIVGVRSRLEYGVEMKDTMMMGSDYYQTEAEIASNLVEGKVPMGVGSKTKISRWKRQNSHPKSSTSVLVLRWC